MSNARPQVDGFRWPIFAPRLGTATAPSDALRIERVIAIARLLLTVIALIQTFGTLQPAADAPLARWLLVFFAAHSISAVLVLHARRRSTTGFALTTHTIDLLAGAITLPLAGPANSFFTFFLFVLVSAAFRWGFRETVATTVAAIALVLLHGRLATVLPDITLSGVLDPAQVTVRATYLAMMGLLLAYLAEESRALRAETAAIARLLGRIRGEVDVSQTLTDVGSELVAIFDASRAVLVVEDLESHRLFRWDTSGGWRVAPAASASGPPSSDRLTYFFAPAGQSLAVRRRRGPWPARWAYRTTAIDASGRIIDAAATQIPATFAAAYPFRRMVGVPVTFGDEWAGQLFVLDPGIDGRLVALTRFLQMVVRQASPALFGVYLQHRLRVQAGAVERARVARELHDGVIQSLIGVEMQLQVLRGQPAAQAPEVAGDLDHLQRVIHEEVLNLRDLMQHMRPPDLDPKDLVDYLARMVDRFGRDNGITARFSSGHEEVALPRDTCFELVRIVQEGLVNIRKHSGATNVVVRLDQHDGHWRLEIDDNGVGFPFSGRLSLDELDAERQGPIVIKERVRAIGGQLNIESTPGRGTRLRILVPQVPFG